MTLLCPGSRGLLSYLPRGDGKHSAAIAGKHTPWGLLGTSTVLVLLSYRISTPAADTMTGKSSWVSESILYSDKNTQKQEAIFTYSVFLPPP